MARSTPISANLLAAEVNPTFHPQGMFHAAIKKVLQLPGKDGTNNLNIGVAVINYPINK
jgi:hypothetical protein